MKVRVLGIDPGTVLMGYGVVDADDGDVSLVCCGALSAARGEPLSVRLFALYRELADLIARYQPTEAAIEEPFVAKNVRAAMAVGQATGVALAAIAEGGIPAYCYAPTYIKQAVTSYGRSDKGQVQEMVRLQLRLPTVPQPEDAADACAVAICHIQEMRLGRGLGGGRER
ncbi:MAG: crossover junction endodeoxyribonuclease RuvC [Chloroflexota bacterium]|nr:crossover junction endodeoxyribonuclease RuvC [Chloroflexota bacterium]